MRPQEIVRFGDIIGFWDVTKQEMRWCFEGRNYPYFYAEADGGVNIIGPAPDRQTGPKA